MDLKSSLRDSLHFPTILTLPLPQEVYVIERKPSNLGLELGAQNTLFAIHFGRLENLQSPSQSDGRSLGPVLFMAMMLMLASIIQLSEKESVR